MDTNVSDVSIEEINHEDSARYIYSLAFFVTVMLIGIVGNILVIVIYKTKFKRSSARVYIISLAIADLSVCLVGIPYHVLDLTYTVNYPSAVACQILSFLIGSCTLSSIMVLLVVGLDRFLRVCRPLKRQIIDFGDRKACLIAVALATFLNIPNGIIYGESSVILQEFNQTGVECFISDDFQDTVLAQGFLGFNLLLFILSVAYLIIIYGMIGRKIYQQAKLTEGLALNKTKRICLCCTREQIDPEEEEENDDEEDRAEVKVALKNNCDSDEAEACVLNTEQSKSNGRQVKESTTPLQSKPAVKKVSSATMIRHTNPDSKAKEKNTRKITLMMMTITIVFILTYLPFIILSLIDSLIEDFWSSLSDKEQIIYDILLRLYLINNVANPLIYGFWDNRFRTEVVSLLRKIVCCAKLMKSRHDESSSISGTTATVNMTTKRTIYNNTRVH